MRDKMNPKELSDYRSNLLRERHKKYGHPRGMLGKIMPKNVREAHSVVSKEFWNNPLNKDKILERNRKISQALKGKPKSPEHIEKNRLKSLGNKSNIETKNKQSKSLKEYYANPLNKEKIRNKSILVGNILRGTKRKMPSEKKGMTMEEIYGKERAFQINKLISTKTKEGMANPLTIQKLKIARINQILPKKDTTIEVKMQNLLKKLGIEFYTHQYMNIEHGYQCDIQIPVQKGITKKTIIECFGTYWHRPYPIGREIDLVRINELRNAGWRVLVFWENEIRVMELNDLQEVLAR